MSGLPGIPDIPLHLPRSAGATSTPWEAMVRALAPFPLETSTFCDEDLAVLARALCAQSVLEALGQRRSRALPHPCLYLHILAGP